MSETSARPLSLVVADFAAGLRYGDVPSAVVDQAKMLIVDALGIAYASTTFSFATSAAAALQSFGGGDQPVIGLPLRLGLRDAAMMNGLLIHGLDYDDTHLAGVVHVSATALPTAMGVAAARHRSGRDLLLGYILAVEVAGRIGAAAAGGFHRAGFHPTGVAGAFGCAVAAARLDNLAADGIATAQGFAGSLASGTMEFTERGAWTKRAHAGWAVVCGITAAAFAREGFVSPAEVYEGRFGLFRTHLPESESADLEAMTRDLGEQWQIPEVAVKLYPSCHFTHAFVDAALELQRRESLRADDIDTVTCLIHRDAVPVVCEPRARKLVPQSDYEAKFSLPFVVASTFVHGRFSLNELSDEALGDPHVLALASRITDSDDPLSGYPHAYSGEVIVRTTSGRELRHREQINRGAVERPISVADVVDKFVANVELAGIGEREAQRIVDAVLSLDRLDDAADFSLLMAGTARTPA
ncbi:MAG: MmgE/PrpD family protein [Acidimicrobiales bacterium]